MQARTPNTQVAACARSQHSICCAAQHTQSQAAHKMAAHYHPQPQLVCALKPSPSADYCNLSACGHTLVYAHTQAVRIMLLLAEQQRRPAARATTAARLPATRPRARAPAAARRPACSRPRVPGTACQ